MLYWFLKHVGLGPLLRILWRPRITGSEHVPERGGAILASNHLSFCDSFFLPLMLSRRVTFLAKAEYFNSTGIKGFLWRIFFAGIGQVPIDRDNADASSRALRTGVRILGHGDLLGIYPEGTRSPDGKLYKGRTGVARMALQAGVVVIPVAMIDTDRIMPTGSRLPRLRPRPGIVIGAPLEFSQLASSLGQHSAERAITDEIMHAIAGLSGQEYVHRYADKGKRAKHGKLAATPSASNDNKLKGTG